MRCRMHIRNAMFDDIQYSCEVVVCGSFGRQWHVKAVMKFLGDVTGSHDAEDVHTCIEMYS